MRARAHFLPLAGFMVLAAGLLGCGEKAGTFVRLKFTGTVSQKAPIKTITVDLTMGTQTSSASFSPDGGIVLPNDASLTIHHGEGLLHATARALAADGTILGTGTGQQTVTRDKTVDLEIVFTPGSGVIDAGIDATSDAGGDGGDGDGKRFDAGADGAGSDAVRTDAKPEDAPVDGTIIPIDAPMQVDAIDAPGVGDSAGMGGASGSGGSATGGNTGTGGIGGTGATATGGAPVPDAAVGPDVASTGGAGGGGTTATGGTTVTGGTTATGGTTVAGGTTATSSSVPAPHVVELASSDNATCARKSDGTVWCWGQAFHPTETIDTAEYQTGMLGPVTTDTATPTQIPGVTSALAVAGGLYHACYLKSDGTVACWGRNQLGQVGNGEVSTTAVTTASPVPGITTAMAVGTGSTTSCALLSTGRVSCWGSNENGALGNSSIGVTAADYSTAPVAVDTITNVTALAMSYGHSCVLLNNGKVACWGKNDRYQLGTTSATYSVAPVVVPTISTAKAVAVAAYHTCALLADKTVWCWGRNKNGTLGDGTGNGTTDNNTPTPVQVIGITTAKAIFSGASHTCALLEDGTANCWGFNNFGRLGDGTTVSKYIPVPVVLNLAGDPLSAVSELDLGGTTTCALKTDRSVYCWGRGLFAANGDPDKADRFYPVLIPAF